jgi:type I restriction enzyme, R subunit
MSKHKEGVFEDEVVEHLTAHGWLLGDVKAYNRELALYPDDVEDWLRETQPDEWAKVEKSHGVAAARDVVLQRLAEALDKEGSLHVLRRGFKHINARFEMCAFKPSQKLNPTTLERYGKVRCRVVRQVHYSLHNANSIDLVFFVNGIPAATAELKTDFTQTVQDAIKQYRKDRQPRDPQANADEPLLQFKKRCLVHFAVSTDEVYMATHLKGAQTTFLPFNQGHDEGAGNPPNPDGYSTAYLWEEVLQRDSWLDILGRFVHLEKKEEEDASGKKVIRESLIFPRFHQWQAVHQLLDAARQEGPGHDYLIQHSAGSGKSNSIAWVAHRLATLHDDNDARVFDTVIVVTDRNVLDSQLQETIYQFEHKTGVVVGIQDKGVKSEQLMDALLQNTPIIILTLQSFPAFLEYINLLQGKSEEQLAAFFAQKQHKKKRTKAEIEKLSSLSKARFAVIADEAHSSQTGTAAGGLTKVLTSEQIEEGVEVSAEDMMLAAMEDRADHTNISYFAFTATPKARTLERFGRVPDPTQPPSAHNKPQAFHVYSMQQAIEENFILDVLKNYTPYKLAFKLAHNGQNYDEEQVDQSQALKSLMRWVRLHPHNISQKVAIIVEHFQCNVAHLLEGRAKAMVVTDSRKAAVRYKLAIDKYIQEKGYALGTLVAFSGEVPDPESGSEDFTESNMNPGLKGRDIRTAFAGDEFQILLVANKFQTGFNQPLLCAMYVDKRLDGITAVQTLSRLNRIYPAKDVTYILDFVNDPQDILAAFLPYYKTAELSGVTDPNEIHTLQSKLDGARFYTDSEVEAFARAFYDPKGKQGDLQAHIAPAVDRFKHAWKEAQEKKDKKKLDELEIFRKDLATFVRMYDFLSQIINYGDTALEGRSIFFRHLIPLLHTENLSKPIDLSAVHLTHYKLKHGGAQTLSLSTPDGGAEALLHPLTAAGSGVPQDPAKALLKEIISRMNEIFEGDLSDADLLNYASHVRDKMLENPLLEQQAHHNSKEQFALGDFKPALMNAVISGLDNYQEMAKQVLSNETAREGFAAVVLELVYNAFQQREIGPTAS